MNILTIATITAIILTIHWFTKAIQMYLVTTRLKTSHKNAETRKSRTERQLRVLVDEHESKLTVLFATAVFYGAISILLIMAQIITPYL